MRLEADINGKSRHLFRVIMIEHLSNLTHKISILYLKHGSSKYQLISVLVFPHSLELNSYFALSNIFVADC